MVGTTDIVEILMYTPPEKQGSTIELTSVYPEKEENDWEIININTYSK